MHLGSSSVAGSGVPPARKSADIIQGIQDAYTQIPSNVKKMDALKGLLQTAIQAKISVSAPTTAYCRHSEKKANLL